jgi:hypothetical protein
MTHGREAGRDLLPALNARLRPVLSTVPIIAPNDRAPETRLPAFCTDA